jgi:hypothetical protein
LVEEAHARVAGHGGRGTLLGLAQRGKLERIRVRVLATLVAARAAHEPAHGSLVDPAGGRAGRPELRVVRVRGDDHEPGRAPGMGRPGFGGGHRELRPLISTRDRLATGMTAA